MMLCRIAAECPRCGRGAPIRLERAFAELLGLFIDRYGADGRAMTWRCRCGHIVEIPLSAMARPTAVPKEGLTDE